MRILLDTHALLWWLNDDMRLGRRARDAVADPDSDVLVSMVSLWEIVVKTRIGKPRADLGQIMGAVRGDDFTLLEIVPAHLLELALLPFHPDHRDPFDHLLVAQAITEHATFLSEDRHAARYSVGILPCSGD